MGVTNYDSVILSLLLMLSLQTGCQSIGDKSDGRGLLCEAEVAELIYGLPAWRYDRPLSTIEWNIYVEAGKVLQKTDSSILLNGLYLESEQWQKSAFLDGFSEESKPYLLLRVMFDLPEEIPYGKRFVSKGWRGREVSDKWYPNWPIQWGQDGPRLITLCRGCIGPPYSVVSEYKHFKNTYPFRNLEEVKMQLLNQPRQIKCCRL